MKVSESEAAALLRATESEVNRWAREGAVPCQLVGDQYWFHRAELLEWANTRGAPLSAVAFPSRRPHDPVFPRLAPALEAGGVHHEVEGHDRDSVLAALARRVPVQDAADREFFLEVMSSREKLGSTGVGDGIAIPHVRAPVLLTAQRPSVTLCFLQTPTEFGAIDGKPVHTVFLLVTTTVRSHLAYLALLSAALHDPEFRQGLRARAPSSQLLTEAARIDETWATRHAEHLAGHRASLRTSRDR